MAAFTASQASVTNGSKVVTINSGESIANIRQGDFLFLAGFLVEINRGYVGAASQQYIELVKNWANSSQSSQPAVVIPTTGDFRAAVDAINNANKNVNDNFVAMQDWQTKTGTVTFTNQDDTTTTVKTLKQIEADNAAQMDAYHPFPWAMRKVEFESRRAANNEKFAASGFVHFGKKYGKISIDAINSGLYVYENGYIDFKNMMFMGATGSARVGESKSNSAIINVAGTLTTIERLSISNAELSSTIKLPPAEDGTRTYDSATGVSVTHATPAIAFASETATNDVVTDRVDMWGFEFFLREINDADPFVYAKGLIQSQASNINGVPTVTDNVRPASYFAWYEGDTTSAGKGVNWQTATEAQRIVIASDPENNIYFDDSTGKFYQWSPRGRSFAGAGNGDWQVLDSSSSGGLLAYSVSSPVKRIAPQGISNVDAAYTLASPYYYNTNHISGYRGNTGSFLSSNTAGGVDTSVGVNGECHFLVCGTVNRLNEGAYHPSLNPAGTSTLVNTNGSRVKWFSADSARKLKSKSDCFNYFSSGGGGGFVANGDIGGSITSNFSGRPDGRFYDVPYASGAGGVCRDMRYSAWGLTKEDFSEADLAIKSGEYRGHEKPTLTHVGETSGYHTTTYINLGLVKPLWWTNITDLNSKMLGALFCILYNDEFLKFKIQAFSLLDNSSGALEGYNIRIIPIQGLGHGIPEGSSLNYAISFLIESSLANEFTHIDVQGSPIEILQCDDLKNGWFGNWLPDLPDGAKDEFALTRPYSGTGSDITRTHTLDNGATWISVNVGINNAAKNTVTVTNMPANQVTIYQYKANAKVVSNALNSSVYGGIGDVWAMSFYAKTWGRDFAYSATSKILTVSSGIGGNINRNFKITDYSLRPITSVLDFTIGRESNHAPIDLLGINNDVGFKALNYNVVENQQGFINYAYTELTHNGTDWGDDSKIHIADNQTTMPDENGHTVLVGTARCVEPLGWIKNDK